MTTNQSIENAMTVAIEEAKAALAKGEFPYGAVVIDSNGEIVSRAHDTVATNSDPIRHAEIDAIRMAIKTLGMDLSGHTLVCTAEPCSMCSSAAWWAGIRKVIFSVSMLELKELVPDSMTEALGPLEELNKTLNDKIVIKTGVMREEALGLWGLK